jgi:Cdc6-like AAA superfamily ATPase
MDHAAIRRLAGVRVFLEGTGLYTRRMREDVDDATIQKVVHLLTTSHVKVRRYNAAQLTDLLKDSLDHGIDLVGPTGQAQVTMRLSEPGYIGSYGFNPDRITIKNLRVAADELEAILKLMEQAWALVK